MRGASEPAFIDNAITGGKHEVLESLTRSVAQICRSDSNVKSMYIGIASGNNAEQAMRRRYDDYKREEGISEMIALYSSSSEGNTRAIETELEAHFRSHGRNINRTGGGGGRESSGPNYYVYVAIRRWG